MVTALVWVMFAPPQLGGSTAFTLISGNSMEPLLREGHIAAIRLDEVPRVGDVALYDSGELGRGVLHRVVGIDDGVLTFQGDNNDFIDPEEVPMSAVVGTMWFHAAHVGSVVEWMRVPLHASLVAAAVAALALASLLGGRRLRRGRGGATSPVRTVRPVRPIGGWAGPIVALLVIVALGVVAFTAPTRAMKVAAGAYRHEGSFSYEARLRTPNPAYPSGRAGPGQPIFFDLFDEARFMFSYRFTADLEHDVEGTLSLRAYISDATGWQEAFDVGERVEFKGDVASIQERVALAPLKAFGERLAKNSGQAASEYSIYLQPTVELRGTLNGEPLHATFKPALPVLVTPTLIRVNTPALGGPPGADVITGSDVMNPSENGSALIEAPGSVRLGRYELSVAGMRSASGALLIGWIVTVAGLCFVQRRPRYRDPSSIAASHRLLVVPVESLDGLAALPVVDVDEFEKLAQLAAYREVPLLLESDGPRDRYAAVVDATVYRYEELVLLSERRELEIARRKPPTPPPPAAPPSGPSGGYQLPSARRLAQFGALGAPLLVIGSVLMTSTASGVVPTSRIGVTDAPATLAQLAPLPCSAIEMTRLATGAKVSGSGGNDLVLGRWSADGVLAGGGGADCIVGPGASSRNTISGGGGNDVCISPVSAVTNFTSCEVTLRPPG